MYIAYAAAVSLLCSVTLQIVAAWLAHTEIKADTYSINHYSSDELDDTHAICRKVIETTDAIRTFVPNVVGELEETIRVRRTNKGLRISHLFFFSLRTDSRQITVNVWCHNDLQIEQ